MRLPLTLAMLLALAAPAGAASNDWSPQGENAPQVGRPVPAEKAPAAVRGQPGAKKGVLLRSFLAYQSALKRRDARAVAGAWLPKHGALMRELLSPSNPECAQNWHCSADGFSMTGVKIVAETLVPVAAGSEAAASAAKRGLPITPGVSRQGQLTVTAEMATDVIVGFAKGAPVLCQVEYWQVGGRWLIADIRFDHR